MEENIMVDVYEDSSELISDSDSEQTEVDLERFYVLQRLMMQVVMGKCSYLKDRYPMSTRKEILMTQ